MFQKRPKTTVLDSCDADAEIVRVGKHAPDKVVAHVNSHENSAQCVNFGVISEAKHGKALQSCIFLELRKRQNTLCREVVVGRSGGATDTSPLTSPQESATATGCTSCYTVGNVLMSRAAQFASARETHRSAESQLIQLKVEPHRGSVRGSVTVGARGGAIGDTVVVSRGGTRRWRGFQVEAIAR